MHVSNRVTDPRNAEHLKAQGLQPGFPDYLVFGWGMRRQNFALELKRNSGERPRMNQFGWLRELRSRGFVSLWGTLEELKSELRKWQ